ncbi:MAG: SMC-Scp complex subunit ScpB [Paracoccus sp. (in: a-proteobacteria)]|uniref:SMC-Scp complex subunit ScpB n=1 Tax=Paracoccus sp. TaxID=267 RepID=UPI0026DEAAD7|nr:SMC-Scp complex subunit ScpB [Paracoccus sp. (in: a-proteobacteria)]MDO5630390.1 SMC-Scp complex subunit ScpB [Paracoccus sp. (in: a-proteobacteria)]
MTEADPTRFPPPPLPEQARMVEALLFASATPMPLREIAARLPAGCDAPEALAHLRGQYDRRGVVLERIGDAYAFRTAPDLSFLMQDTTTEQRRLSRAATETLAIIAYHQPVTRAEIEEIRGVAVSRGTLDQLLDIGWIRVGRRRMTPGRPVTFVVTESFLDHFGLESARDLPGLTELRAAGLLESTPPDALLPGLDLPRDQDEDDDIPSTDAPDDLFEDEP